MATVTPVKMEYPFPPRIDLKDVEFRGNPHPEDTERLVDFIWGLIISYYDDLRIIEKKRGYPVLEHGLMKLMDDIEKGER